MKKLLLSLFFIIVSLRLFPYSLNANQIQSCEEKPSCEFNEDCCALMRSFETEALNVKESIESVLREFKTFLFSLELRKSRLASYVQEYQSSEVASNSYDLSFLLEIQDMVKRLNNENGKNSFNIEVQVSYLIDTCISVLDKFSDDLFFHCQNFKNNFKNVTEEYFIALDKMLDYLRTERLSFHESSSQSIKDIDKHFDILASELASLEAEKKTQNAIHSEASSRFFKTVDEKAKFLLLELPTSQFYNLPFLSRRYQSYMDFLRFSETCQELDDDKSAWMDRGCILLKRHSEEVQKKLKAFPRNIQSYLQIVKIFGIQELRDNIEKIEALLEKDSLEQAIAHYENMLLKAEKVMMLDSQKRH